MNFKTSTINLRNSALLLFILICLDLFTKHFQFLYKITTNGFIYLDVAENRGSAFSLFSNVSWYNEVIIIVSIVLFLVGIYYIYKHQVEGFELFIFTLFGAGLLGNLFDRIFLGYVRDFLGIQYFAIINIADIYLSLAAILLVYFEYKKDK